MAITVPRPSSGSGPLGSVGVAASKPVFQNFQVPSFKTADTKLLGQAGPGVTKVGEGVASAGASINKRRLNALDASASELERSILDSIDGLNSLTGKAALARIYGRAPQPGVTSTVPGETLQEQYARQLKDLAKTNGVDEFGGKEASDIWIRNRVTAFGSAVDKSAISHQKLADSEDIGVKIANAIENIRKAAGSASVRKKSIETIESGVMDGTLGLATLAGLDPNSKDPKIRKQLDQLLQSQLTALYLAEIEQLLADNRITTANDVFKEAIGPNGPIKGHLARTKLAAKLNAVNDLQSATDGFEKILGDNTSKDGIIDYAKIFTEIIAEKDAIKQKGMMTQAVQFSSLQASLVRKQENAADQAVMDHLLIKGLPITSLDKSILAQASDGVKRGVFTGSWKLGALRNAEALGTREAHIAAGGPNTSAAGKKRYFMELAAEDPAAFLKETENPTKTVPVLAFKDHEAVMRERAVVLRNVRKARVEAEAGVKFKHVNNLIERMGFSTTSAAYKTMINNQRFTDQIDDYRVDYVKDHGRLPSEQEVFKEIGPLLLEVYDEEPGILPSKLGGAKAAPFFAQAGASPSSLDSQYIDVSSKQDRQRIADVFGTTKEEVAAAVKKLSSLKIKNPTVKQMRVALGGVDADEVGDDKAQKIEKGEKEFDDLMTAAGINPDVARFAAKNQKGGGFTLNFETATSLAHQFRRNKTLLDNWTAAYDKSLGN